MSTRDFLIERYCFGNWAKVRGECPFISQGPRFTAYTTTSKLESHEWKLRKGFVDDLDSIKDHGDSVARESIAELLLREGIVQAMWSVAGGKCVPDDVRWTASVEALAAELSGSSLASAVIELLSGIATPQMHASYLSEDQLELVPVTIPPE